MSASHSDGDSTLQRFFEFEHSGISPYPFQKNPLLPLGHELKCGRLMKIQKEGGILLCNFQELPFKFAENPPKERLKDFVAPDSSEASKSLFEKLRPGDFVAIYGRSTSALFIALGLRLLGISLQTAPKSVEHLQEVKKSIFQRHQLTHTIRNFFHTHGFLEVETPQLLPSPGLEPFIDPFETHFLAEDDKDKQKLFLSTSPEYNMKKLLCADFTKIFQICRSFRNGELQGQHNPEFSMLEWYRAFADASTIMADLEELLPELARIFHGKVVSKWRGQDFFWKPPYEKISVETVFRDFARIDIAPNWDPADLKSRAQATGIVFQKTEKPQTWNELFSRIFVEKVEPHLPKDRPFFLVDYPLPQGSLAKTKEDNPNFSDRFEIYLGNVEVGNGFSELNNPFEQRRRFEGEQEERLKMGKPVFVIDEDFIDALTFGMPPSGGIAVGLDRLLMVLADLADIKAVLGFPFAIQAPH